MGYVASAPGDYSGQVVGDGACVAFVRACSNAPASSSWREGEKVRGNQTLRAGAAIATFVDGAYPSAATGNHAAIYIGQTEEGIQVWDQWRGQPVHQRTIRFRGGEGSMSNDGDAFSVIE
jgi:hypothetical protein